MGVSVSVSDDLTQYLAQEVASGRYATEADLVAEALRLHRELRERHERLQAQILHSIEEADRGELELLDIQALIERGKQRLAGK
jgi:putative addiction module CopG family antidote